MAEILLSTTFQLRRGYSDVWARNNPILRAGEPGFELDTYKLKIGNGTSAWNDLAYFEGSYNLSTDGKSIIFSEDELKLVGFAEALEGQIPRKNASGSLEWFTPAKEEDIAPLEEALSKVSAITEKIKYEISHKPKEVVVDYRDSEIRVFCPENTSWVQQNPGPTGNANYYYLGFKAYAPSDDVVSFKEDTSSVITDDTMYYFENNDFAGIDKYGRKYSICWLAAAKYDSETQTWSYLGEKSTTSKYIGWDYSVEWYNAEGIMVASDVIRINLSNKDCHNVIADYYMGQYQKLTDFISVDRLTNAENTILILDGGSAENAII